MWMILQFVTPTAKTKHPREMKFACLTGKSVGWDENLFWQLQLLKTQDSLNT